MAHEVSLYRKHRPKTFDDYEGDFIGSAVKRVSDPLRRPQVIMFHGGYGCGKTTAARLFAGFYLCESLTDKGTPCGVCSGCMQLVDLIERGEDDGTNESIQEINGSEVNRIEDIRRIMKDSMLTLPSFSKYKVFIFDECHRITPEAQNALLKVLEDVPEHLVVIFATTEKKKMLPTILSRCQVEVEVRKQSLKGMVNILRKIAEKEGFTTSNLALEVIAKKGKRIPRDCINLLEDVAANYDNQITAENVLAKVGEVDSAVYSKFITAAHKDFLSVVSFVKEFSEGDIEYSTFLSGLSRFILEAVYMRMGMNLEEIDPAAIKARKALFSRYKADEFSTLLKIVSEAIQRSTIEANTTDLALTVLGMNIGSIFDVTEKVSGDSVKAEAQKEDSEGAKKFVERDNKQLLEGNAPKPTTGMDLKDFMSTLGVVKYEGNS